MILFLMALPHYSVMYGMHCSSCHYRVDGGGIRKGMGKYLQTSDFPLKKYPYRSFTLKNADIGLDARLFYMQYSGGSYIFPMQFTLFARIDIHENFELFIGKSLTSSSVEAYGRINNLLFSGSYIRFGIFPPNVGLRYEDHTFFVRDYLDDGAANYFMQRMENGALEVGYTSQKSALSAGVINSLNNVLFSADEQAYFANASHLISGGNYTLLAGASTLYQNPSKYMMEVYAGAGIRSLFAVIGDFQHYNSRNVATISARWMARRWFHLLGVYNISYNFSTGGIELQRYGGGFSMFLLPALEYQFRFYYQSDGAKTLINGLHFMF